MTASIKGDSRDDEFETAGRFFPVLHAFIQAASLNYPPERVTCAQVKAFAMLQTGCSPYFGCNCGEFRERAKEVHDYLGVLNSELLKYIAMPQSSGKTEYAMFRLRRQDRDEAIKREKFICGFGAGSRLMVSCGWGMFLTPGKYLAEEGREQAQALWLRFLASPPLQVEMFMRKFDELLVTAGGDVELAAAMYEAGNEQLTKSTFGKQYKMTLNRLLRSGHRET
jgi:hypothetical protein